jgi:hypothetical protein
MWVVTNFCILLWGCCCCWLMRLIHTRVWDGERIELHSNFVHQPLYSVIAALPLPYSLCSSKTFATLPNHEHP